MINRIFSVGSFYSKNKSNIVSAYLRPLFEHKSAKNILGLPLLILTLISGAINTPLLLAMGVVPANIEAYYQPYERIETNMITKPAINYPVADALGVSQGFHVFHPGVDIRAPLGSEIKPVADGTVIRVAFETFGYGHRVEIAHENGVESLYAHMDEVKVSVGDTVTTTDTIGTVGMTGRTTGPHLHLEIRRDSKVINPITYLAR